MKSLRTILLGSLLTVLAACSDLPEEETPLNGVLSGTITAVSTDRSSLRLAGTSLWIPRQNDVLTLPSVPPTKFLVKGKVAALEGLKVGQKVKIKVKEGYALEISLLEKPDKPDKPDKTDKPDKNDKADKPATPDQK